MSVSTFLKNALSQPIEFWEEQRKLVHFEKAPDQVLDFSNPPFRKWFVGGLTNICYNAVDRHLAERGDQNAIVWVSTEVNQTLEITYRELYQKVNQMAATLQSLEVGKGDRVLIYLPMIADALIAMLACTRIGAIHSVVFGGFASHNLAVRIEDATPKVIITSDAGMRNGKAVHYKPLIDKALAQADYEVAHVLVIYRDIDKKITMQAGRDQFYHDVSAPFKDTIVPICWLESNEPSYLLYTSGTTGKPKGVQRDTGGYLVTLAASIRHIYDCKAGDTIFTTSDVGWVVGHSYIVYAPLIMGMTTIVYEGMPTSPDAGIWWRLIEQYKVNVLFSSPTAARVLKKQDTKWMQQYDLSSLKYFFLAGEPLDEPTAQWLTDNLPVPIIDHYWQTETGSPMITYLPGIMRQSGLDSKDISVRIGSPGFASFGYDAHVLNENTGEECLAGEKGLLAVKAPLPPGCLSTIWQDDARFLSSYFSHFDGTWYSTSDWAVRDHDGFLFILGRTDDVINVAGHRIGTREIEEAIQHHSMIAEVAVVGREDELKGQVPIAFCTLKNPAVLESLPAEIATKNEIMKLVADLLGAIAKPAEIYFIQTLPKTRSGKLLRRAIQAVAEGNDPGDLSTMEDPFALEEVKRVFNEG